MLLLAAPCMHPCIRWQTSAPVPWALVLLAPNAPLCVGGRASSERMQARYSRGDKRIPLAYAADTQVLGMALRGAGRSTRLPGGPIRR